MDKRLCDTNLGDTQLVRSKSFSDCCMWDMPDEILVEIFVNLNARDRVVLSDTCTRFTRVLLQERKLWRDLDFSQDGHFTTVLDIKRYFDPGNAYTKNILKVNLRNVNRLEPKRVLYKYISVASNLVDINIHGMKFESIKQLTSFLVPLIHVRRLSIDWPETKLADAAACRADLSEPFGRLVYLSVEMTMFSQAFAFLLRLCQELEELRMVALKECEAFRIIEQVDYQERQEQVEEHFRFNMQVPIYDHQGREVVEELIWDNEFHNQGEEVEEDLAWDNEEHNHGEEVDEDVFRFHARLDQGGEVEEGRYWVNVLQNLEAERVWFNELNERLNREMQQAQNNLWNTVPAKLSNLKLVEYCGKSAVEIKGHLTSLLVDGEQWTDFQVGQYGEQWTDFQVGQYSHVNGFYLEKNVEICRELLESRCLKSTHGILKNKVLFFDDLLNVVIKTIYENDPAKLSCLSNFKLQPQCMLQIEDAKLLLKDPLREISYLCFNHNIHQECDTHFVGLAFTHLTELVLSNITKSISNPIHDYELRSISKKQTHPNREKDSCFKLLVVNTPFVKHVTLDARISQLSSDETWDLDGLYFIVGWKSLMTLRLYNIPVIDDAKFLIAIGKRCTLLEVLELHNLGPPYYYEPGLLLMLPHCQNLREFSMSAPHIVRVHEVVTALSKNPELQKVRLKSKGKRNTTTNLPQSVGQLLSCCSKLTTLYCVIGGISEADSDDLTTYLTRWKDHSDRKQFQFQVILPKTPQEGRKVPTVFEDAAISSFPCKPHSYL